MPKLDIERPLGNYSSNPLLSPLWETAHRIPTDTALRFINGLGEGDVTEWTWTQFLAGIHAAIQALRDAHITPGDRVLMLLSASPEYLLTFWALIGLGAQPVSVPLTPEAPLAPGATTLRHIACDCNATAIVTTPTKSAELSQLAADDAQLKHLAHLIPSYPHTQFANVTDVTDLPDTLDGFGLAPVNYDSPVYIQYSSGSTGAPKGVVNHYGCILNQVNVMVDVWASDTNPNSICWLPLHHDMGIVWGIFDILCTGGTAGFIPTAVVAKNPTVWVEAMSRYRCGMTASPDTMWRAICSLYQDPARRRDLDLSSVRIAVDGGEPVNPRTLALLQSTFGECGWREDTLSPMYGLAEAGLCIAGHHGPRVPVCIYFDATDAARGTITPAAANPEDPTQRSIYAVGDDFFHLTCRIVNPDTGEELAEHQVGEIWFQGVVSQCYLDNESRTKETFDAYTAAGDGPCLRTGDMGFLDDAGNLYISGRMSNTIIVGGENYFPADIEQLVIDTHLGFTPAQVCATQSELDSDWFVVIAEAGDVDQLDRDAYSGLIARAIARSIGKQPTQVLWWDEALPKTSSGKIARAHVADEVIARRAAAANAAANAAAAEAAAAEATAKGTSQDVHPLLAHIAEILNCTSSTLDRTADVTTLGLTSLAVNELLTWSADNQHPIDPAAAWDEPTIDNWIALYDDADATQADATQNDAAAADASATADTSPTDLQKSYFVGADPKQPWGGVECLAYSEFELNLAAFAGLIDTSADASADAGADNTAESPADLAAMCDLVQAAVDVVDQEPALHTAMPNSATTIYAERPAPTVTTHDFRHLPAGEGDDALEQALNDLRTANVHRTFATEDGDNWAVELSALPDGTIRAHITLSLICADIVGSGEILQRLDAALRGDLDAAYPPHAHHTFTGKAAAVHAGSGHGHSAGDRNIQGEPAQAFPLPPDVPMIDAGDAARNSDATITRFSHTFTAKQWGNLAIIAQYFGTTPAGLALASYDAVLRRWSGRDDFLVTLTTINAPQPQQVAERTIAVAHRAHCNLDNQWQATLADVRDDLRASIANPIPLTTELRAALASSAGHTGLSPYIFTYAADQQLLDPQQVTALGAPVEVRSATPQVLIDCQCVNTTGNVTLSWDVRTDGIRADVAQQMFDTLVQLLKQHTSRLKNGSRDQLAQQRTIDLLPLPQKTQRQRAHSNSTTPVTTDRLLYEPFLEHVRKQPKHVALVWDPQDQPADKKLGDPLAYNQRGYLTYQELDCMVRRLAAGIEPHIKPSEVVGIQLPKGPCQVIAALAVLYAGGTYLPVNVNQPADRLQQIKDSSGMRIILRRGDLAAMVSDELGGVPHPGCDVALPRRVNPSELAYIIYTSGSTGAPKGVAIRHYSALNTCLDVNARNGVTNEDRILAISALEFDLSVYDIFGMLSAGGTIVCIGDDARRDAFRWADMVKRFHVTIWDTVPGLGEMLYAAAQGSTLPSLRRFYFSGDWIALDLPARLKTIAPNATCISMGGATEGSIWSNEYVVQDVNFPADWKSIPYGGPLTGQKYRVVNPYVAGFPDQPDYVPGELWIGGAGVAAGYFGQPDLTAERYPVDADGNHWYRTGDLGEYHTDGLIFFAGRMDTQVKIRGHRVECGEVEHACHTLTGVDTAIVVPIRKNSALGAVLVTSGELAQQVAENPAALRDQLATKLPDYMVPAVVMPRQNLPHTPNGKIDRRLLAHELENYQHQQAAGGHHPAAPAATSAAASAAGSDLVGHGSAGSPQLDEVAQLVVNVWADVLGEDASALATATSAAAAPAVNFFALGGDSLAATTVCSQLTQQGCPVAVADLFSAPTLPAFISRARGVYTGDATRASAAAPADAATTSAASTSSTELLGTEPFPFTSLQQAYALGADGVKGITCTTPAVGVILTSRDGSSLDPNRFAAIIAELTAQWEPLRCVRAGDATQAVHDAQRIPTAATIRTLPVVENAAKARAAIQEEFSGQRIPLDSLPVMNVVAVEGCGQYIGLSMNYLGLDARSIGVVLNTILDRYEGRTDSFTVNPSARPFCDYVHYETSAAQANQVAEQQLPDAPVLPATDKQWTATSDATFTSFEHRLPAAATRQLQDAVAAAGVTLSAVVLQSYGAVIAASSGLDNCGISVPISQRPEDATAQQGSSEVLGNFTELALVTLGTTTSVQDVHKSLGHLTDGTLPTSRDIARAGRAAYPVVFTSTTGVAALRRAGNLAPDWVLTRTPGVQLDCQVMVDGDTGELLLRWDYPAEYVHSHRLERLFNQFVEQVQNFAITSISPATPQAAGAQTDTGLEAELEDLTRELSHATPPPAREIMAAALAHLATHTDSNQHTPSVQPLPAYQPLLAEWRNRSAGITPSEAAARTGTWLADALCGAFDAADIVGHPVLSPQALLLQEDAAPQIIDTIVDVITSKYQQLGRPVSVVELGSGIGLVKDTISRRLSAQDVQMSWQDVERDQQWRASAAKRDEIPLETPSDIPADVVLAVASLHRDPRLLRDLATIPTLSNAELVIAEATQLSDAALVSAVVVEPSLLQATDYLHNAGQWWMTVMDAAWQPYTMSTPSPHICVVQARRVEATAAEKCPVVDAFGQVPQGATPAAPAANSSYDSATPEVRNAAELVLTVWSQVLTEAATLQLDDPATWDADFFALGGDSLAATQVLQALKAEGYNGIRLVDLFNTSQLGEFAELIAGSERDTDSDAAEAGDAAGAGDDASAVAGAGAVAGDGATASKVGAAAADADVLAQAAQEKTASTHPATHPLTGVQQAYLAGRSEAHILGGVASHCYYEFTALDLDREAFTAAIRTVVAAHDELRAYVVDGVAEISADTPDHVVTTVADPRAATEQEAPDPAQQVGMVVRLSEPSRAAAAENTSPATTDTAAVTTVAIGMDNLILDGASMMLVLQEIDRTYRELVAGEEPSLQPEELSFGGYLATHQDALPLEDITDAATATRVQRARDYWTEHVAQLPPAPQIAERKTVLAIRTPEVDRVSADVPADVWQAAQAAARAQRITPASLLLGAYTQALAEWTGMDEFTVNVTLFDRDFTVPGIERVVGDFTSLTPVACTTQPSAHQPSPASTAASSATLADVARHAQQNLATVRDYDSAGALWVQRELLRLTGDPYRAMLPVVYTCGLGLLAEDVSTSRFSFGTMRRVRSQTPQTLLDMQVYEDVDGLHITADYVLGAVDTITVQQAINSVAQRVTAFAHPDTAATITDVSGIRNDIIADADSAAAPPAADSTPSDASSTDLLYQQISPIWEEALDGVAVTPDSNFFMEGGDSLRATTVTRQVQDATGRDVDLRILLTNPTLRDYVQAVAETSAASTELVSAADSDIEEGTL